MTDLTIKLTTTTADRHIARMTTWVSLLRVLAGSLLMGSFLMSGFFSQLKRCAMQHRYTSHHPAFSGTRVRPDYPRHLQCISTHCCPIIIGVFLVYPTHWADDLIPIFATAVLLFGTVNGLIAAHYLDGPNTEINAPKLTG